MSKKLLLFFVFICIVIGIWCSNYLTYNFNTDPLVFGTDLQKEQYSKYKNAFSTEKEAITIGIKKEKLFYFNKWTTNNFDTLKAKKFDCDIKYRVSESNII